VKTHLAKSSDESIISNSLAMACAVSLLSPVIMITRIPAVLHALIAGLHSGLTGSLMQTHPTKVAPCSYSLYFEMSPSLWILFYSVISDKTPAFGISAIAKHLSPSDANLLIWSKSSFLF